MKIPPEEQISRIPPAELRYLQARYFYEQFLQSCGSLTTHRDRSFHWISYCDAFLMAFVSLQDFVGPKKKTRLLRSAHRTFTKHQQEPPKDYEPNVFLVLKLMRNQTIHRYVISSPTLKARIKPTVTRIINVHVGGPNPGSWVQPKIHPATMRRVLNRVMARYRKHKKHNPTEDVEETRLYLKRFKQNGGDEILLADIFEEGLRLVEKVCGFTPA